MKDDASNKEIWQFGMHPENIRMFKAPLNETVVKNIIPIYVRLTNKDLLKSCSLGQTQIANEALYGLKRGVLRLLYVRVLVYTLKDTS